MRQLLFLLLLLWFVVVCVCLRIPIQFHIVCYRNNNKHHSYVLRAMNFMFIPLQPQYKLITRDHTREMNTFFFFFRFHLFVCCRIQSV